MREYLEQLLLVLAVGSAVAIAAKRVGVPYNVALVVVGLLLVLMNVLPDTPMDPGVVLLVFLPDAGLPGRACPPTTTSMRQAARPILALARARRRAVAARHGGRRDLGDRPAVLGGAAARRHAGDHRHRQRAARVPQRAGAASAGRDHGRREPVQRRHGARARQRRRRPSCSGASPIRRRSRACWSSPSSPARCSARLSARSARVVLRRTPDDLTAILASLVAVFATSLVAEQLQRLAGDRAWSSPAS